MTSINISRSGVTNPKTLPDEPRATPDNQTMKKSTAVNCAVFVGVSLDGFLARPNGDIDWLTGHGEPEDFGYNDFMAGIDAIIMGRKTFETVVNSGKWYYGNRRLVVLSHGDVNLDTARALGGTVEQMAGSPAEIVSKLAADGAGRLYVDGGITIQEFLRAGLVRRLIISRLPVLIGEGIPLFGPLPHDVWLQHIATRTFQGGMIQSEYHVLASPERLRI